MSDDRHWGLLYLILRSVTHSWRLPRASCEVHVLTATIGQRTSILTEVLGLSVPSEMQ